MGGRADETNRAALQVREQDVLLRLVEAVDLVDEEDGRLAPQVAVQLRLGDLVADLGDVRFHPVEGFETRAGGLRDDIGERCFPGPRRAVENERGEAIRLDGAAQELALTEDVILAQHLAEGLRAHPCGKRFGDLGLAGYRLRAGKEIGHRLRQTLNFKL